MITPDKIYIPYYPNYDGIDTHLSDEWFEGKAIDHVEGWKEYICKDALMEWAKEMKEQVGLGLNAYDMGEENGKADILSALIDKLNSM